MIQILLAIRPRTALIQLRGVSIVIVPRIARDATSRITRVDVIMNLEEDAMTEDDLRPRLVVVGNLDLTTATDQKSGRVPVSDLFKTLVHVLTGAHDPYLLLTDELVLDLLRAMFP